MLEQISNISHTFHNIVAILARTDHLKLEVTSSEKLPQSQGGMS